MEAIVNYMKKRQQQRIRFHVDSFKYTFARSITHTHTHLCMQYTPTDILCKQCQLAAGNENIHTHTKFICPYLSIKLYVILFWIFQSLALVCTRTQHTLNASEEVSLCLYTAQIFLFHSIRLIYFVFV